MTMHNIRRITSRHLMTMNDIRRTTDWPIAVKDIHRGALTEWARCCHIETDCKTNSQTNKQRNKQTRKQKKPK